MARPWRLPAILLLLGPGLAGCGPTPAETRPALPCVWLQPARFEHYSWNLRIWTLLSGKFRVSDSDDIVRSHLEPAPQSERWWTLCDGAYPKFQFLERPGEIRVFQLGGVVGTSAFATIPLPLRDGQTWTSIRRRREGDQQESACCSFDRIQLPIGTEDTLRVDFSTPVGVMHSMWFSPIRGLVKWEGFESGSLDRIPESAMKVQIVEAACSYAPYGRIDQDLRWAPTDCRAPVLPPLRTSSSRDEATHGRKQYYLYAKDRLSYLHARDVDQPDGQVVVKESWLPGQAKTKGPLFLMLKSQGEWTYATATPDGSEITGWGRLASCMECHESGSTRDRMFGLTSCAAAK